MAKIGLPKGSGQGKVSEKSGNFEMDIEWQPWVCYKGMYCISYKSNNI